MELSFFGRFQARAGCEHEVERVLRDVVAPSRAEAGCLSIEVFRANRNPRLFLICSRWVDEAAFDFHAGLPHTVRFIEQVEKLIDHPLDVTRTTRIA